MSTLPGLLLYSDKLMFRLLRHLFLFVSMVVLFSWIVSLRGESGVSFIGTFRGVFINALFFFGYAYITGYLLVPLLVSRKKYILFVILFLVVGLLISYLKFIVSDYLFYSAISADMSERIRDVNISHILMNSKDMTFIVAIFLITKFAKDNYHIKMRLRELQNYQIRSEIKLLRNQLDPHVVFNNLNNMYSLAINNSSELEDNLIRFKSVLQYFFVEGKGRSVPLSKELKTIEDFISLEKLRYGDRLSVEYKTEGAPNSKFIIPFVLFSFVENCFEHGCSIDSGDAWIRIHIKIEKDSITFHTSNSKPKNVLEIESGTTKQLLASKRNKMDLLYPGNYLLRIDDRKDMYCLDLKIKL